METNKKIVQLYTGEVISDKMDKTRVVKVQRTYMHPRFKKVVRTFKKYKVHDEANTSKIGDKIEFYEGRPVSKTKYMYLHRIINSDAGHAKATR
jgi:small subunit ribosomal protein S17